MIEIETPVKEETKMKQENKEKTEEKEITKAKGGLRPRRQPNSFYATAT